MPYRIGNGPLKYLPGEPRPDDIPASARGLLSDEEAADFTNERSDETIARRAALRRTIDDEEASWRPGFDAIVEQTKGARAAASLAEQQARDAGYDAAERRAWAGSVPLAGINRQLDESWLGTGLDVAAGIGSVIPGPHQPVAVGYGTVRAGMNAIENPTPGNLAMAVAPVALERAIPAARALGSLTGIGKASGAVDEILRGADAFADAAGRSGGGRAAATAAPTSRVPYARPTPFNPAEAHMPNTSNPLAGLADEADAALPVRPSVDRYSPNTSAGAQVADEADAAVQLGPLVDRFMPNTSSLQGIRHALGSVDDGAGAIDDLLRQADELPDIQVVDDAATAVNASGESAASVEALNRASGMLQRGEQFGVYDKAGRFRPLIGPDAVDYVPRAGETYGIQGPQGFQVLNDMGGRVRNLGAAAEEQAGALRGAARHGTAGFSELPNLSPDELRRIGSNIKRVSGR